MKKFILYIFIVLLGLLLIDLFYRYMCIQTFEHPSEKSVVRGGGNKFYYIKEPYNIAVIGASRAEFHYQTKMIEDAFALSSYNYGGSGCNMLQNYLSLLTAIDNGELQLVILDLSPNQLSNNWVNERSSSLFPFYWENDTIRDMLSKVYNRDMDYQMLSALIQYNSQLSAVISTLINRENDMPELNGWHYVKTYTGKPIEITQKDREHEIISNNGGYSSLAIDYFRKFTSICKKRGVHLIVCLSPSLVLNNKEKSDIKKLCDEQDVTFWNLSNYITDPRMYGDPSHLNKEGSELFTKEIIIKLNEFLKQ